MCFFEHLFEQQRSVLEVPAHEQLLGGPAAEVESAAARAVARRHQERIGRVAATAGVAQRLASPLCQRRAS